MADNVSDKNSISYFYHFEDSCDCDFDEYCRHYYNKYPLQYNQNELTSMLEEKEDGRTERSEAGYEGDAIYEPADWSGEIENIEGGESGVTPRSRELSRCIDGTGGGSIGHTTILAERIIPEILRNNRNGQTRIVRESIQISPSAYIPKEISYICRMLRDKGTVFIISRHEQPMLHYHVVHTCPWKWYQCKCYSVRGTRRSLRTTVISAVTESDWNSILQYLSTDGRLIQHLSSGYSYIERLHGIEFIPNKRLPNAGSEAEMEECQVTSEDHIDTSRDDDNQLGGGQSCEPHKKLVKPTGKARYEDLETMIMTHLTVPLHSACNTNDWQASKFRFINGSDTKYRNVIDSIRKRICQWKFDDFMKYYKRPNSFILWESINSNVDEYYFNTEDSYDVINKLLEHQFYDYAQANNLSLFDSIAEFLNEVYEICEKKRPKVNTLELIGPASSGKSYFADMICAFYINVGHVKNFNKNENFPLQSCCNRRILLWNEAQCEQSQHDTIKLLLGGDPCPANIKYMDTQTINRTPVIITANKQLLPNTRPFSDRMIRYTWIECPFLKAKKLKPRPDCLHQLLFDYGVIE